MGRKKTSIFMSYPRIVPMGQGKKSLVVDKLGHAHLLFFIIHILWHIASLWDATGKCGSIVLPTYCPYGTKGMILS